MKIRHWVHMDMHTQEPNDILHVTLYTLGALKFKATLRKDAGKTFILYIWQHLITKCQLTIFSQLKLL